MRANRPLNAYYMVWFVDYRRKFREIVSRRIRVCEYESAHNDLYKRIWQFGVGVEAPETNLCALYRGSQHHRDFPEVTWLRLRHNWPKCAHCIRVTCVSPTGVSSTLLCLAIYVRWDCETSEISCTGTFVSSCTFTVCFLFTFREFYLSLRSVTSLSFTLMIFNTIRRRRTINF